MPSRNEYPRKTFCYGVEDGLDGFCVHAEGCIHEGQSWTGPNAGCIQPQDSLNNNVLGFVLDMFGDSKSGKDSPFEPNAGMRGMASANWECYQAHIQKGFTSDQAMQIILKILEVGLIAGMTQNDNGDGQ